MASSAPALETCPSAPERCTAITLLDIVEASLHSRQSEWLFYRELRVGTGRRNASTQRLDAFALNTLPHTGMRRVCYEIKISRGDFLCELKHPLKRRVGMRYSNEFYFVTPPGLVSLHEIPAECGLIEAGTVRLHDYQETVGRQAGYFHLDPASGGFCVMTVPAQWRDTPGPSWQFTAAMLRHQKRQVEGPRLMDRPQQKFDFAADAPIEDAP